MTDNTWQLFKPTNAIRGVYEAAIQYYLDSVKDYKRNKFRKIDPKLEAELREEYKFAFDAFGYE